MEAQLAVQHRPAEVPILSRSTHRDAAPLPGPGGRFTSQQPGVFMVGWNACSEHVMSLQRANMWIYFQPAGSELITGGAGRGDRERWQWGHGDEVFLKGCSITFLLMRKGTLGQAVVLEGHPAGIFLLF